VYHPELEQRPRSTEREDHQSPLLGAARKPSVVENGRELLRAFDAIDLARVQEVARRRAAEKGAGLASVIAEELREQVRLAMRMEAAE
jgi:hypothetical protein